MKKIFIAIVVIIVVVIGVIFFRNGVGNGNNHLTLYGNVDIRTVNLSYRVPGRLTSLAVDEGDYVTTNQLLGQIDEEPYQISVNQAQANVESAKANLAILLEGSRKEEINQAKAQVTQLTAAANYANNFYQRQFNLRKGNNTSQNDLDNALNQRDQANANLKAAKDKLEQLINGPRPQEIEAARAAVAQQQALLDQAKLNLRDTKLLSPADGIILTRAVEPGTLVQAGTPILSLSLTHPVWVRAYIDEVNLSKAIPGNEVKVYSDSIPNKVYTGKIGFVSPTAEFTPKSVETPVLRTELVYRLRIIITNPDSELRQGMPVTIQLNTHD